MRTLILALAFAMAATSVQAGEKKPLFETVSSKTPKAILTCYLGAVNSDPQVTELDDGYMLVERVMVSNAVNMRIRLTETPNGTQVRFWTKQIFGKQVFRSTLEACSKP